MAFSEKGLVPVWVSNPYPERDAAYRKQWLPRTISSRPPWVPAELLGRLHEKASVRTLLDPPIDLTATDPIFRRSLESDNEDLASLSHINIPNILDTLMFRFCNNEIFTFADDGLLVLNPQRPLVDYEHSNIYDEEHMRVSLTPFLESNQSYRWDPPRPHIYTLTHGVVRKLLESCVPQTVCLRGPCGAGKSTSLSQISACLVKVYGNSLGAFPAFAALETIEEAFCCARGENGASRNLNLNHKSFLFTPEGALGGISADLVFFEEQQLFNGPATYNIFYYVSCKLTKSALSPFNSAVGNGEHGEHVTSAFLARGELP